MTTNNTSRPASGTSLETRVCVTCDQPIVRTMPGNQTRYIHAVTSFATDHPAEPKLAHPMDVDPFALTGADDCDGSPTCPADTHVDGCFSQPAEPVFRSEHEADAVIGILTGLADIEQPEPVFPPAEPEPSISLAQFQQRVAAGEWGAAEQSDDFHVGDVVRSRHTLATMTVRAEGTWLTRFYELVHCPHEKPADPIDQLADATDSSPEQVRAALDEVIGADPLAALHLHGRRVHQGQVSYRTRQDRRARNRRSRAARRANRNR
jgi:hypothetical protein